MTLWKMQVFNDLVALNKHCTSLEQSRVTVGLMKCARECIILAKEMYPELSTTNIVLKCIVVFKTLNRYSMVVFPISICEDHFRTDHL